MEFLEDKFRFTFTHMKKFSVISNAIKGTVSAYAAAEMLGVSRRHIFRLKKRLKQNGMISILHGNRGKTPHNKITKELKEQIFEIFDDWHSKTDLGVNSAHLQDILSKECGIQLSRQTLWRWLRATGRRMPLRTWRKHRKARERSHSEGQILFLDGSEHPWLGKAYPSVTLILCTDDATSKALYGVFVDQENLFGCFEVAYHVFSQYGLPHAFYLDRASQFKTTRKKYDSEYVLAPPTHWQKAMSTLAVRCIYSYSPQARGRGERANGTFQGRLASELQYHKITDLREATTYLNKVFIPGYNQKFSVKPRAKPIWREKPSTQILQANLAIRQIRLVGNDNCVWFENTRYQILPHPRVTHVYRAEVEVRKCFDGVVTILHKKYGLLNYKILKKRTHGNQKKIKELTAHPNLLVTKSLLQRGDQIAVT